MARIWGDAAQIEGALGLASGRGCQSTRLYRVYFVWKQYAWYLIPLPLWMLANWGLYVVDIQRALDLGEKYTEASLISFHHQRVYGRLAVIFIESSSITSTCRLVWMAAFASNNQNAVSWVESIAAYGSLFGPLLVIFRMVHSHSSRKGTGSSTGASSSTMASGSFKHSQSLGSPRANTVFIPPKSIQPQAGFSPSRSEDSDSQFAQTNYEKV
ncbi:hypothetical protein B0H14DRAFT_2746714 [Mycena olivaceomarginata]|nr:hypothetical protein B0H14DRAFT_2746714 [Mycena olivaceomarginata]